MKAIINGLLYDTETANHICDYTSRVAMEEPMFKFQYTEVHTMKLYRTQKGRFFVLDKSDNEIIAINEEKARKIVMPYPDKYIELFGEVEEA